MVVEQRSDLAAVIAYSKPLVSKISACDLIFHPHQVQPQVLIAGDLPGVAAIRLREPQIAQTCFPQRNQGMAVTGYLQATQLVIGEVVAEARHLSLWIGHKPELPKSGFGIDARREKPAAVRQPGRTPHGS